MITTAIKEFVLLAAFVVAVMWSTRACDSIAAVDIQWPTGESVALCWWTNSTAVKCTEITTSVVKKEEQWDEQS